MVLCEVHQRLCTVLATSVQACSKMVVPTTAPASPKHIMTAARNALPLLLKRRILWNDVSSLSTMGAKSKAPNPLATCNAHKHSQDAMPPRAYTMACQGHTDWAMRDDIVVKSPIPISLWLVASSVAHACDAGSAFCYQPHSLPPFEYFTTFMVGQLA